MLWFLKYFRRKIWQKYWRFLLKLQLVFAKILIITLVFEKNANFFAENLQKSQKIVIITSTPGRKYELWLVRLKNLRPLFLVNYVHTYAYRVQEKELDSLLLNLMAVVQNTNNSILRRFFSKCIENAFMYRNGTKVQMASCIGIGRAPSVDENLFELAYMYVCRDSR
jgi:hypothetical protein